MSEAQLPPTGEIQATAPEISQDFEGFNRLGSLVSRVYANCDPNKMVVHNISSFIEDPVIEPVKGINFGFKFNIYRNGPDKAPLQYTFDRSAIDVSSTRVPINVLKANIPFAREDPETKKPMTGYTKLEYTWVRRPRGILYEIRDQEELENMPPRLFEIICDDVIRIDNALRDARARALGQTETDTAK